MSKLTAIWNRVGSQLLKVSFLVILVQQLSEFAILEDTYKAIIHPSVRLYAFASNVGSTGGYKLNCALLQLNSKPSAAGKVEYLIIFTL